MRLAKMPAARHNYYMQQLQIASVRRKTSARPSAARGRRTTKPAPSPLALSRAIVAAAPAATCIIREIAARYTSRDISFPKFRALAVIHRSPNADLSTIAAHLALTLSATSRLVDALVSKKLLLRKPRRDNRRKVRLTLTAAGRRALDATTRATESEFARRFDHLTVDTRAALLAAMHALLALCADPPRASD